jgi:hypothetical protein
MHTKSNIRIILKDIREIKLGCLEECDVVQDKDQKRALVKVVMKLRAP